MVRVCVVVLSMLAALVVGVAPASAGSDQRFLVVDTVADTALTDGPTGCDVVGDDNPCTLREAIERANGNRSPNPLQADQITFDPSISGQTISLQQDYVTGDNQTGDLDILGSVTIDGDIDDDGTGDITVSAAGIRNGTAHDRVFEVTTNAFGDLALVTFEGLTIRDGYTRQGENGGGIGAFSGVASNGTIVVTLDNVLVTANVANSSVSTSSHGGGIYAEAVDLSILDSTVSDNFAQLGGGIATVSRTFSPKGSDSHRGFPIGDSVAFMDIANSTITDNATLVEPGLSGMALEPEGAGILVIGTETFISHTIVSDNGSSSLTTTAPDGTTITGHAPSRGGGIAIIGNTFNQIPTVSSIEQSIVAGNAAATAGGGLSMISAIVDVTGTTFTGNTLSTDGDAFSPYTGGGAIGTFLSTLTVANSTLSGNAATNGPALLVGTFGQQAVRGSLQPSEALLTHVTLADNAPVGAPGESNGAIQIEGGDFFGGDPMVTAANSILQSPDGTATCVNNRGEAMLFASQGGNSSDDIDCGLGAGDATVPTIQQLAPLADNDSTVVAGDTPTQVVQTRELLITAEGVDSAIPQQPVQAFAGIQPCDEMTDQRGLLRGTDGNDDGTPGCDRGAFERQPRPDLTVDKTGPSTAVVGGQVTFQVVVSNATMNDVAPATTAVGVTLTDTLPAGLSYVSDTAGCTEATGVLTCALGDIAAGASATVGITATAATAGAQLNRACAATTATEVSTANNCDDHTVTVAQPPATTTTTPSSVDLSVEKTGPGAAALGDEVTFDIAVTNVGGNGIAGLIEMTDALPEGTTAVSAGPDCSIDANVVTCDLGALAQGGTTTAQIVATVDAEGALTNTACVTTASNDTNSVNDCDDDVVTVTQLETERVEGPERITTAVAGSQAAFPDGASSVILTTSDNFPDSQAGTPLAVDRDGPLLLSAPGALSTETEAEIIRVLDPGATVSLLGGTAALSQAVFDRIVELGFDAQRIGGSNRYATAVAIATDLGDPGTLLIADGGSFPAAIVAGAAATVAGGGEGVNAAVLLTAGSDVPVETQAYLDGRSDEPTMTAIGEEASSALPDIDSIVGEDASEVSANVAARYFPAPRAIGVATVAVFADGLTGGSVINRPEIGPGPILLTDPDSLPQSVADYVSASMDSITRLLIFGGQAAISPTVEDQLNEILGVG